MGANEVILLITGSQARLTNPEVVVKQVEAKKVKNNSYFITEKYFISENYFIGENYLLGAGIPGELPAHPPHLLPASRQARPALQRRRELWEHPASDSSAGELWVRSIISINPSPRSVCGDKSIFSGFKRFIPNEVNSAISISHSQLRLRVESWFYLFRKSLPTLWQT